MVVMEDVTEEERSAELYVSVHGGLDHTFLKRGEDWLKSDSSNSQNHVFTVKRLLRTAPK